MLSLWVRIDNNNVDWERSFSFPYFASLVHRLYHRLFSRLAHKYCSFLLAKRVYNLVARAARSVLTSCKLRPPHTFQCFLLAKAPYWNGANQRRRRGGEEREIFSPSPSPLSFFRPRTYSKGYYFYSPQYSSVIKSKMAATTIRT